MFTILFCFYQVDLDDLELLLVLLPELLVVEGDGYSQEGHLPFLVL